MNGGVNLNGEFRPFGFYSIPDWLNSIFESFPAPWKVAELRGKHYGTKILDATGKCILAVWNPTGEPSLRELDGMVPKDWHECCSDGHWESESALARAESIVACRNSLDKYGVGGQHRDRLRSLMLDESCRWDESIISEIRCGGPERRLLPDDPEITGARVNSKSPLLL